MPTDPISADAVRHPSGCLQPVLLHGRVDHIDGATGELLHRYTTVHEPGGLLPIACKTRRASQCPPCAEVYRADTYQLIRAGLTGGKGIPATVANHPCVFTTLTAPSFGPVHSHRERNGQEVACRPRRAGRTCPHNIRMSCPDRHGRDDERLGEPLCPDCYDYVGSVLFNACAPELWRRFAITLRRTLARLAGLTNQAFATQARLSYAKVAEYQRRGIVHFHAIIRLDGPTGPATAPPTWATLRLLTDAIDQAARTISVQIPAASGMPARTLAWGRQLDTRPITATGTSPTAESPRTSPNTPPRPPSAPAPSTAGSPRPISSPSCPSASTPAAISPPACAWPNSPALITCTWLPGLTCSASLVTSPPRAVPTQPPSALFAPTEPPTSGRPLSPLGSSPTYPLTPRSPSPIGTTPDAPTCRPSPSWPPSSPAPLHQRREVRHDPAPADRPRSRPGPGHLPQQALRAAGQRRYRLDPHRRITTHPLTALEEYVSRLLAERTAA